MNVNKITAKQMKINDMSKIKSDSIYSYFSGSYFNHVKAKKNYASAAVKDFHIAKIAPSVQIKNIPIFSRFGMRLLWFMILDRLRFKSKDEKLLKKLVKADRIKTKYLRV